MLSMQQAICIRSGYMCVHLRNFFFIMIFTIPYRKLSNMNFYFIESRKFLRQRKKKLPFGISSMNLEFLNERWNSSKVYSLSKNPFLSEAHIYVHLRISLLLRNWWIYTKNKEIDISFYVITNILSLSKAKIAIWNF